MTNHIINRTGPKPTYVIFLSFLCIISGFLTCDGANRTDYSGKRSLVVAITNAPLSLDPTNYRDRDTQKVIKNMFDSLTTRDKHLLVVPQLAKSWKTISPTKWEFKLRKGVKFHNGQDFTAIDVKFTLDRVIKEGALDGQTSPRKALLGQISEVRIIDRFTVMIMTTKPWPVLPLMLTLQEIIPKEYMQRIGSAGFEKAPIGTGPFRFVKKLKDGTLILERFENYYGGSPENIPLQLASLKHLIFKIVVNPAFRMAMLKKGQAQIITNLPRAAIPLFDMLPDIKVLSQPATRSFFADLNCNKPPFDNPLTRVALNYAMDMQMIVRMMFDGRAQILPTILSQDALAFNDQLLPYPYDPERAKNLFRQSNFPQNYTVKIFSIEIYSKFANAISLFLSKIGIQSTITIDEKSVVRAAMKNREADILVTSWGNTTLDPVGILLPKLKSNGRGNLSNYSNKKIDQLLSKAESTLTRKKRFDYYKEIQKIIYEEAPMLFGFTSEEFYGVRKRVRGFQPSATGMLNLHDIYLAN
jgi:peptide/nickel transport system substrate-binding protein